MRVLEPLHRQCVSSALGVATISAVLLTLHACSAAAPTPPPRGGLSVQIVCDQKIYESPCGIGGIVVTTTDGVEVARRAADGSSAFQVALAPGDYKLASLAGTTEFPVTNIRPERVTVVQREFVDVKITYWDGRR